jgi:hypothetical protein
MERPEFSLAGMTAQRRIAKWMGLRDYGHRRAGRVCRLAGVAGAAGLDEVRVKADMRAPIAASRSGKILVGRV